MVFWPRAFGSFLSPSDKASNFRMFKLLAQLHPEAPAIVHEIAASEGSIIVTWGELGLGGIRRLVDLFTEFCDDNKDVDRLARSRTILFDPAPYPPSWEQKPTEEVFVREANQPEVLEGWRRQLREFIDKLRIV